MTIDELIAQARKMAGKATPGPLFVGIVGDPKEWCLELFTSPDPSLETGVATMWGRRPRAESEANAQFFAFARNHLITLVDEIERLRVEFAVADDAIHAARAQIGATSEDLRVDIIHLMEERDELRTENERLRGPDIFARVIQLEGLLADNIALRAENESLAKEIGILRSLWEHRRAEHDALWKVVAAARDVDVEAWDTCEFHVYATGECGCGLKRLCGVIAALPPRKELP